MRSILLGILGFMLIILGTNCQNSSRKQGGKSENQDVNVSSYSVIEHQDSTRVQIIVSPQVLLSNGKEIESAYIIYNHLDGPINFDSSFIIEKKVEDEWIKEPFVESLGFEDIMLSLDPGSSKEYPLLLSKVLKIVNPGEYRIIKVIWPVDKIEEKISMTANFTVK